MRRSWISLSLSLGASLLAAALATAQDGNHPQPQAQPQAQQAQQTSTGPHGPHGQPTQPTQLSPEDEARRARVVAKVGAVEITVGEVEDAVNRQSPILRARYRDRAAIQELVEDMIRFELLAAEAERERFGDDPEVVKALHQNAVQQMIRQDFDERITVESIPMADVLTYYEAHPEEFAREEMRRASHIQVATREEALRILEQARGGDARTFRTLAREHSLENATKLRGGDLRYFDREGRAANSADPRVTPEIVRAAFAIQNRGELAPEPIEVEGHFSVVQLTGVRPAEHRSIEQAEATIRLRLWRERRQAAIDGLVERLRTAHVRDVHEDRLREITLDAPERLTKRGPNGAATGEGSAGPGEAREGDGDEASDEDGATEE